MSATDLEALTLTIMQRDQICGARSEDRAERGNDTGGCYRHGYFED